MTETKVNIGLKEPCVLAIAGSDSSAGAGIQADLKTAADFGVYCATAITAVTAQNTMGVSAVLPVAAEMVAAQIEAVVSDLNIKAIKIGLVPNPEVIDAIAHTLKRIPDIPVVIDPVMISSSSHKMAADPEATAGALISQLFPIATVVTPNIPEFLTLLGKERLNDEHEAMEEFVCRFGCEAVCLKGGHGEGHEAVDRLMTNRGVYEYEHPWVDTQNSHGTGCTFSTAIACGLVEGLKLHEAVATASQYVYQSLLNARHKKVGEGAGPLSHDVKRNNLI